MSEKCHDCGTFYDAVYWVPGHVWKHITPSENEGGGLLCVECAHRRASDKGFALYFGACDGWWSEDTKALNELKEREREILVTLRELHDVCVAAIHGGDWSVDGACDPDLILSRSRRLVADAILTKRQESHDE